MEIKLIYPFQGNFSIIQYFGGIDPIYNKFGMVGHNGIDWAMPERTPIYASYDGIVGRLGYEEGGYGNYVRLNTNFGRLITAHLSEYVVKQNQSIKAGDLIGYSGNTGFSTTPHLHFEMRLNSEPTNNGYNGAVDPLPYLDGSVDNGTIENPPIENNTPIVVDKLLIGDKVNVLATLGANLRDTNNSLLALVYYGTAVEITGESIGFPDGITRYPVKIEGYIAQVDSDGATIILSK